MTWPCRDEVPLVERRQKRARIAEEGEMATTTEQDPILSKVVGSSPQRESNLQFPLASSTDGVVTMETDKEAGGNLPKGEHQEIDRSRYCLMRNATFEVFCLFEKYWNQTSQASA